MNNNVTLDTYDIFKEIYESGSLTKASEKLHIAQPSISYRIKALEDALGVKLFNRTAKGMEATPSADKLYANIKDALNTIKYAGRTLVEEKTGGVGDIYIGVQHHIGKYYLTKILKKYTKEYPNVRIHIINKGTASLVELLEHGKIDFIIDTLPINSSRAIIKMEEIATFHTCFAKIKGAPNKYILPVVASTMRNEIEKCLQERNIIIAPSFEVYTTEMMIEMVKEKMGIAYTIKEFIEHEIQEKLEFQNIIDELPELTCCIAYIDKKQSFLVQKFIEMIRKG